MTQTKYSSGLQIVSCMCASYVEDVCLRVEVCVCIACCASLPSPHPPAPSRTARVLSVTEAVVDSLRW